MSDIYDEALKLDNQICFPLYAVSKELTKHYTPLLNELDLTYTQYITMMVLWEKESLTLKELGDKLYLDSGTLTPLIKKLENKGYLTKKRSKKDNRDLIITITQDENDLKEKAKSIPFKIASCIKLDQEEAINLYATLNKLLKQFKEEKKAE